MAASMQVNERYLNAAKRTKQLQLIKKVALLLLSFVHASAAGTSTKMLLEGRTEDQRTTTNLHLLALIVSMFASLVLLLAALTLKKSKAVAACLYGSAGFATLAMRSTPVLSKGGAISSALLAMIISRAS